MLRVLAVAGLALVWASPARAFTAQDLRLPMDDGVSLAASLYLPDGPAPAGGWPGVVALHGLGGTRASWQDAADELAAQGYAVLAPDLRGHGDSGGQNDIDGPRTVADVRALFDWLAARPDVDGARIAAVGISLGGGAVWRAAVEGIPFATIVPITTWTDLYSALVPNGLSKSGAVLGFLNSLPADRFAPVVDDARTDLLHSTNLDRIRALAQERSSLQSLSRVRVPVLLLQGRRDFAFDIGQAVAAYRRLRVPKLLYIGNLGHAPATNPPGERAYYVDLIRRWLDRWLEGLPNGVDTAPPVQLALDPWRGRAAFYRGLPATTTLRLPFRGRSRLHPSGKVVRTRRLPRAVETFGAPVLQLGLRTPTGWPSLVAVLSADTPRGEVVVSVGGMQTSSLAPRKQKRLTMRLVDQATRLPRGARLRLTLATSSTAQNPANLLYLPFAQPETLTLAIAGARLKLPVLRRRVS